MNTAGATIQYNKIMIEIKFRGSKPINPQEKTVNIKFLSLQSLEEKPNGYTYTQVCSYKTRTTKILSTKSDA